MRTAAAVAPGATQLRRGRRSAAVKAINDFSTTTRSIMRLVLVYRVNYIILQVKD
jgi:hypothetical protein